VVSTLPCYQRSDWAGLYDRSMDDEEVEHHPLHCFCRCKSGCYVGDGSMECLGPADSSGCNCSGVISVLQDGLTYTLRAKALAHRDIVSFGRNIVYARKVKQNDLAEKGDKSWNYC